jgi:hypothetical protein
MDHGCDFLSFSTCVFLMAQAGQFGNGIYTFILLNCVFLSSYSTSLLEYNVHILRTHIGHFGVAEGLIGEMVLLFILMFIDTEAPFVSFIPFLNFKFLVSATYIQK